MSDSRERTHMLVQEKLAAARQLLIEVGALIDDEGLDGDEIEFAGLKFESRFGWFRGDELEIPSEWNSSGCVIGSKLAEGESNTDWQSSSWCVE